MRNDNRKDDFADFESDIALLRAIIDSAPEGIVVADNKGNLVLTNRAADELYSHPASRRRTAEGAALLTVIDSNGEPYNPDDLPLRRSAVSLPI